MPPEEKNRRAGGEVRVAERQRRAPAMGLFGLVFVGKSFPVDASQVAQISQTNWVLDVTQSVTPAYTDLKEICLFLSSRVK